MHLRLPGPHALQFAADQQVELLVGAAQFDVGLQRHRVVTLHQRVEELMDGDRLVALKRLQKSSRSSIRATVCLAASLIMPAAPSGSDHSEL